jgi:hypothetical protein
VIPFGEHKGQRLSNMSLRGSYHYVEGRITMEGTSGLSKEALDLKARVAARWAAAPASEKVSSKDASPDYGYEPAQTS